MLLSLHLHFNSATNWLGMQVSNRCNRT